MQSDVKKYAERNEETVFSLFGDILSNRIYRVTRVVIGGPRTERSHVSCSTDEETVSNALKEEQEKNKNARYLGDFHSHPWPTTPSPSGIDIDQLQRERRKRPWFIIGVFSSKGELRIFGENGSS